jgi:DNA-damage-inducible protein D
MDAGIDQTIKTLEAVKLLTKAGGEYWMARTLQTILGYDRWENFEGAIEKALVACVTTGEDPENHFRATTKMVEIGSGARREQVDYFLDRYACYLIAMNGNAQKVEIATAQTYFAVQTRRQELNDRAILPTDELRLQLREQVKIHIRGLNSTAKQAGVQRYALFHDAGYRALYEMGLAAVKRRKGIGEKENLFDRVGSTELAAHYFRITQTDEKIKRENINTEADAINAHLHVGREVRQTIKNLGGAMPENLPAEQPINQLKAKLKKRLPPKRGD